MKLVRKFKDALAKYKSNDDIRVRVAKDIIKQVSWGQFQASPGTYGEFEGEDYVGLYVGDGVADHITDWEEKSDTRQAYDARKWFTTAKIKKCNVCQIGAATVAFIQRFDGVTCGTFNSNGTQVSEVTAVLGNEMLRLMEAAFEGSYSPSSWHRKYDGFKTTRDSDGEVEMPNVGGWRWRQRYPDANLRMVRISENVIRNEGKFCINDIPGWDSVWDEEASNYSQASYEDQDKWKAESEAWRIAQKDIAFEWMEAAKAERKALFEGAPA